MNGVLGYETQSIGDRGREDGVAPRWDGPPGRSGSCAIGLGMLRASSRPLVQPIILNASCNLTFVSGFARSTTPHNSMRHNFSNSCPTKRRLGKANVEY